MTDEEVESRDSLNDQYHNFKQNKQNNEEEDINPSLIS